MPGTRASRRISTQSWADMEDSAEAQESNIAAATASYAAPVSSSTEKENARALVDWGALTSKVVPASKHIPPPRTSTSNVDLSLDSSRDGLPLLLKQMNTDSSKQSSDALESVTEETTGSALTRADSRLQKRKQPEEAEPAAIAEMTSKGSARKPGKAGTATQSASFSAASAQSGSAWNRNRSQNLIASITGQSVPTVEDESNETPSLKKQKTMEGLRRSSRKSSSASALSDVAESVNSTAPTEDGSNDVAAESSQTEPSTGAVKGPAPNVLSEGERLSRRIGDIALVKGGAAYLKYITAVPKPTRTRAQPRTPNPHKQWSKRGWDGLMKKWKKQLYEFDSSQRSDATSADVTDDWVVVDAPNE